ncbi:MAG TPA: hypothetical protein VFR58_03115 [Flavisolibacter sp.]|nr:hypothetical protein [Flavisolibacter sp.]
MSVMAVISKFFVVFCVVLALGYCCIACRSSSSENGDTVLKKSNEAFDYAWAHAKYLTKDTILTLPNSNDRFRVSSTLDSNSQILLLVKERIANADNVSFYFRGGKVTFIEKEKQDTNASDGPTHGLYNIVDDQVAGYIVNSSDKFDVQEELKQAYWLRKNLGVSLKRLKKVK